MCFLSSYKSEPVDNEEVVNLDCAVGRERLDHAVTTAAKDDMNSTVSWQSRIDQSRTINDMSVRMMVKLKLLRSSSSQDLSSREERLESFNVGNLCCISLILKCFDHFFCISGKQREKCYTSALDESGDVQRRKVDQG